jgi:hypothetical protein
LRLRAAILPGEGVKWRGSAEARNIGSCCCVRYQQNLVGRIRGPALVSAPDACPAISKRQLACSHGTDPRSGWPDPVSSPGLKAPSSRLGRDIIGLFAPHHASSSALRSVEVMKVRPGSTVSSIQRRLPSLLAAAPGLSAASIPSIATGDHLAALAPFVPFPIRGSPASCILREASATSLSTTEGEAEGSKTQPQGFPFWCLWFVRSATCLANTSAKSLSVHQQQVRFCRTRRRGTDQILRFLQDRL